MTFLPIKSNPPAEGQLILITDGLNAETVIYTPAAFQRPGATDKYDTPRLRITDTGLHWAPITLPAIYNPDIFNANSIFMFGKYKGTKFSDIPGSYFLWLKQQKWFIEERTPRNVGLLNYILTIEEDAQVERGIEIGKMRRM